MSSTGELPCESLRREPSVRSIGITTSRSHYDLRARLRSSRSRPARGTNPTEASESNRGHAIGEGARPVKKRAARRYCGYAVDVAVSRTTPSPAPPRTGMDFRASSARVNWAGEFADAINLAGRRLLIRRRGTDGGRPRVAFTVHGMAARRHDTGRRRTGPSCPPGHSVLGRSRTVLLRVRECQKLSPPLHSVSLNSAAQVSTKADAGCIKVSYIGRVQWRSQKHANRRRWVMYKLNYRSLTGFVGSVALTRCFYA